MASFCPNCGRKINTGEKFCVQCGQQLANPEPFLNERQEIYAGRVIKCPVCGMIIDKMTAVCPSCGHLIESLELSSAVKKFADDIKHYDEERTIHRKKLTVGKGIKKIILTFIKLFVLLFLIIFYFQLFTEYRYTPAFTAFTVGHLPITLPLIYLFLNRTTISAYDKQETTYINNFVFPGDKKTIIEAIFYIRGKVRNIFDSKRNGDNNYWIGVWKNKAEELYEKSKIVSANDKDVEAAHSFIVSADETVKKDCKRRRVIPTAIIIIYIIVLIILALLPPFTKENLIPAEDCRFSTWLSDNYKFGEDGCRFVIDNGKIDITMDVICVKNPSDEISHILEDNKMVYENSEILNGSFNILSFGSAIGKSSNNQIKTYEFVTKLLAMEEGERNTFNVVLMPAGWQKYILRDYMKAKQVLVGLELIYIYEGDQGSITCTIK